MMTKLFEEQLKTAPIITEEILEKLSSKNYDSGDPIKVGDKVVFAYRYTGEPYDDPEFPNGQRVPVEIVMINENQIDQYEFIKGTEHLQSPVLKK